MHLSTLSMVNPITRSSLSMAKDKAEPRARMNRFYRRPSKTAVFFCEKFYTRIELPCIMTVKIDAIYDYVETASNDWNAVVIGK